MRSSICHLSQTIMWVGGYDDWTPAEQREWDRDLEELEREQEEREQKEREQKEHEQK